MGSTPATTPTDPVRSGTKAPPLSRGTIGTLCLTLAAGLLLLGLGVPRFLGAATALPARPALWEIREGRSASAQQQGRAVTALEQSSRWSGTPAFAHSELALLKLLQFESIEDKKGEEAQALLLDAQAAQAAGLAKAPASATGWARLAHARYLKGGVSDGAPEALSMSLLSGNAGLPLHRFRLSLILLEWDALGPAFHEAARGEIWQLTRHHRPGYEALADLYLASPRGDLIDTVLADSPPKKAQFDRWLNRKIKSP